MNIYVGNLSFDATQSDIENAFSEYGDVKSVNIITDRDTGRSRGFGFVEMHDEKDGRDAIEGLNLKADRRPRHNGQRSSSARRSRCWRTSLVIPGRFGSPRKVPGLGKPGLCLRRGKSLRHAITGPFGWGHSRT